MDLDRIKMHRLHKKKGIQDQWDFVAARAIKRDEQKKELMSNNRRIPSKTRSQPKPKKRKIVGVEDKE